VTQTESRNQVEDRGQNYRGYNCRPEYVGFIHRLSFAVSQLLNPELRLDSFGRIFSNPMIIFQINTTMQSTFSLLASRLAV